MSQRGKLKIFFGYSAGVGKTYAMLQHAIELIKEGEDIVLGYFEPHDRPDTIRLTEGMEMLPLKEHFYRGILLKEFDVDAAIVRNPKVILLDELAHTNAAGSKNRKRYLDAEELLNNGINVWTTINVQHIEGLHDLVDTATGVDVFERVPDEIFDYADEIVLVDIEPAELIERMNAGKIYQKRRTITALENFFSRDNLLSLRELSMRRNADRIEKLTHNGRLTTKILALISPSPSSQKIIRTAARMAEAYHCKFSAMYVERQAELNEEAAAKIKKHMNLVKDMGGEIIVRYSDDVVEMVASYVKIAGVTNLIIGKTWQSVGKKVGLEDKFVARLPELEIMIIPDSNQLSQGNKTIKSLLQGMLSRKSKHTACDTANNNLNTINQLAEAAHGASKGKRVAEILANAFGRSCIIMGSSINEDCALSGDDTSFFASDKELAVADWCMRNIKPAGRGTDTLRDAAGIYLPLQLTNCTIVIAFSCNKSKFTVTEKLMFNQISSVLRLVLDVQRVVNICDQVR